MAPTDLKKRPDYSVLCGLGNDSSSSSSITPTPSVKDEPDPTAVMNEQQGQHKRQERPQSLTLPFDNRERESHLVSEEEFDRIAREAQDENVLPALPAHFQKEVSETALRRSISTARNPKKSFFGGRRQHMSADFGYSSSMIPTGLGAIDDTERTPRPFRTSGLPRDPSSLTALPRAQTRYDLANYHDTNPTQQASGVRYTDAVRTPNRVSMPNLQAPLPPLPVAESEKGKKGHRRGYSMSITSGGILDSVMKRLKLSDSPAGAGDASASSPKVSSAQDIHTYDGSSSPALRASSLHSPGLLRSNNNSKRSFLSRAFSRNHKKQAPLRPQPRPQRLMISSPLTMNPPTPISGSPTRATGRETDQTLIDALRADLARRNASVTTPLSDPLPPVSRPQQTPAPRPAAPEPVRAVPAVRALRTIIPPTKSQLQTTVARQQSRIQDLAALNTTLIGQVEWLNREVEDLRSRRVGPRAQALGGDSPVRVGRVRARERVSSAEWEEEEEEEDRRRTWMTVDSE